MMLVNVNLFKIEQMGTTQVWKSNSHTARKSLEKKPNIVREVNNLLKNQQGRSLVLYLVVIMETIQLFHIIFS